MKTSMILGKKQMILAALVVVLSAAVYLNWQFAGSDMTLDYTNMLQETDPSVEVDWEEDGLLDPTVNDETLPSEEVANEPEDTETGKNLGDTLLVDARTIGEENYFAVARLARTKARDLSIETISIVLDDDSLPEADKQAASQKAITLTDLIEAESRIENLVRAKGFEDCMAYLTENSANVVVKTQGLDGNTATQIKNIVVAEGKILGENVYITEIN